ncbi:MAG: IS5 family transposase [Vicinamibacterales bacterium]
MRGEDRQQATMFSYLSPEQRVPADRPLRAIRTMVDAALDELTSLFEGMYADRGRPSIPPEKLLRALILQLLYSIRSERLLMEQLAYNLLFRWFVGLNMDELVWDASTFSKNRDRFMSQQIGRAFFAEVVAAARASGVLSDEHFTVDGTRIEAWASVKSFRPKADAPADRPPPDDPGNPTVNFHGERRTNETHQSTTDPEARLYKKGRGTEAKLSYLGHVTMENRSGLVVDARLTPATGTAERDAALAMAADIPGRHRVTMGGDKGYDTRGFVAGLRALSVTPHVAQNTTNRRSAIDARTTRQRGYAISQRARKRVEEVFGWMKTIALMRKTRHRGVARVDWMFTFTAAVYNLVRLRTLALAT